MIARSERGARFPVTWSGVWGGESRDLLTYGRQPA